MDYCGQLCRKLFTEIQTLQFGSYLSLVQFNAGFCGHLEVFKELDILPGNYTLKAYGDFDKERINDSRRHSLPATKLVIKKFRAVRKSKISNCEKKKGVTYQSGAF